MSTYLILENGDVKLVSAVITSSGAVDAARLVATDTTGRLDPSLLPPTGFSGLYLSSNRELITTTKNLISTSPSYQYLLAEQDQIVNLPDPVSHKDLYFRIFNKSTGPFVKLIIYSDGVPTSLTLRNGDIVEAHSDGVEWNLIKLS